MRSALHELYPAVRSEGGLLSPDLLSNLAGGKQDFPGTKPQDYHLLKGERLGEATAQSWNRMRSAWASFQSRLRETAPEDPATSLTRERFLLVLFQELQYGRLPTSSAVDLDGRSYPISHFWQHSPIHLLGCNVNIDKKSPGVPGAARMSPHGMVQEFLNRSEGHLWAFLSNGLLLRILRDSQRLTRQAYVEFDLEAIFEGELYPDFVLLWMLCHQSRVESEKPEECWLEKWSELGYEQGTRALDVLRKGVEAAISALGRGFISHRGNSELRENLRSGKLSTQDYYRQILRLVYRLIFLFVTEDRGLLLSPDALSQAKERYARHYSTSRLRSIAETIRGTAHADLYCGLRTLMDLLGDRGHPELGLPPLGSYLWSREAVQDLVKSDIANRDLLEAVRSLAFTRRERSLWRVDFRNLGVEELGSVYESLLEFHPDLNLDAGTFELRIAAGHERKTTGSYYTCPGLVQSLLDTALEPILNEGARSPDPEKAILELLVCDPACGSGHFLIAAAHRMAKRLSSVRTGDEEPSPEAVRSALRDIIGRCLYGVDLNPMAVELCKVSLWMEAVEPGKPLSFLDHRIQCGNSLLGATPELMAGGIPDEAFKPLVGDDPQVVREYKKKNRVEREGQRSFFAADGEVWEAQRELSADVAGLEDIDDTTLQGVQLLEMRYGQLLGSDTYSHEKDLADTWCGAFIWPKVRSKEIPYPVTEELFERLRLDPPSVPAWVLRETARLADRYRFFHWHLAFPYVFRSDGRGVKGGFDVVLGNPPWERIKLQESEWFSERQPDIASAPNAAARKRMITALKQEDPALFASFMEDRRKAEGESSLVRNTGRFPLCGRGDVNTYTVFAELSRMLLSPTGRAGIIVPSGIATDDTTKYFFRDLVENRSLVSLFDFENREKLFPAVDSRQRFCLLTLSGRDRPIKEGAEFVFFALRPEHVDDSERRFSLSAEDFALMNPNTRTCPIFRSRRDAEITRKIYERVPVLIREGPPEENPWGISFLAMFHMANDSGLFRTRKQLEADGWQLDGNRFRKGDRTYLPLYEAKMLHHFDHRWGTYDGGKIRNATLEEKQDPNFCALPRYWVPEADVDSRLAGRWDRKWLLGWRDITNTTNERTVIASVFARVAVNDKFLLMMQTSTNIRRICSLLANLSSICFDYFARQKLGGTSLKYYTMKQMPILAYKAYMKPILLERGKSRTFAEWILLRVLELVYTSSEMQPFALDCGYEGDPFPWDEERRFQLRCELDAAFFHLYGINRDDVDYILDTFPIVRRHDEKAYGEFRTKTNIMELYDAMEQGNNI